MTDSAQLPSADSAAPRGAIWPAARPRTNFWVIPLCALLYAAAIGAAVMMTMSHLGALTLPGCGPGSACDAAANSWFGKVPGTQWPISYVGTAYFSGLLVAWLLTRGRIGGLFLQLIRLGVVMSVVYVGAMISGGYLCKYCLIVHSCNLLCWGLIEKFAPRAPGSARGLFSFALVFVLATGALGAIQWRVRENFLADQQRQADASLEQLRIQIEEQRKRAAAAAAAQSQPTAPPPSSSAPAQPATFSIQPEPQSFPIGNPGTP